MVRVVLLIGCIGLVLSLGVLPFNLHDRSVLVVNILALSSSSALVALAVGRLYVGRRRATRESPFDDSER